jgi:hypothetical protein
MRLLKLRKTRGVRVVWVALAALSLLHAPLPQPDFHNVRHHDAPGEVCEYHDHLLRWHPGAAGASDVAVLHWHWFVPSPPADGATPADDGPAVHAHAPTWLAASWDDAPRVTPDTSTRLAPRPLPCPLDLPLVLLSGTPSGAPSGAGAGPPLAFGATFAPGVSLASLLHRWNC